MSKSRYYYYLVFGRNRYIPISFYTMDQSIPDARISFYTHTNGTDIDSIYRITKKNYETYKERNQQ